MGEGVAVEHVLPEEIGDPKPNNCAGSGHGARDLQRVHPVPDAKEIVLAVTQVHGSIYKQRLYLHWINM